MQDLHRTSTLAFPVGRAQESAWAIQKRLCSFARVLYVRMTFL